MSAVTSTPVHTMGTDTLAAEASVAMSTRGVSRLPVLDEDGDVGWIVSAGDLMSLEARDLFALRRSLRIARDEDGIVTVAGRIAKLYPGPPSAQASLGCCCVYGWPDHWLERGGEAMRRPLPFVGRAVMVPRGLRRAARGPLVRP